MDPLDISNNVYKYSFVKNLTFLCFEDAFAVGERRQPVQSPSISAFNEETTTSVSGTDAFVLFVAGAKVPLAAVSGEEVTIAIEAIEQRKSWGVKLLERSRELVVFVQAPTNDNAFFAGVIELR